MSRRFWLINLLLIFILVLLSVKVYGVWTRPNTRGVEAVASKPKPVPASSFVSVGGKKETAPAKGFQSISEKNLFSPERKEFPILASPDGKKGSGRPNIVLYGVTLGEDYQAALITNPGRRAERGERETMSVKVGEKVGEYQVAKISADRITLENEGDSFDVLLYDASQPKKRSAPPTPPPSATARPSPYSADSRNTPTAGDAISWREPAFASTCTHFSRDEPVALAPSGRKATRFKEPAETEEGSSASSGVTQNTSDSRARGRGGRG